MRRLPLNLLLVAMMFACVAAAPATRPTTVIDPAGCVTEACHGRIKTFNVMHGPAASNACGACHELTSPDKHTFRSPREKSEMCTYCHEFSVKGMPVVHKPVADGQCLGCHDPHGGDTHAIIREASTAELCARCHGALMKDKKHLHSPVAQGACDTCHPPHAAMYPKLLDAIGSDLCLACHKELDSQLASAKFKHKAMNEGCEKCHDVHGSSQPMSLLKPANELCLSCHEPVKNAIAKATVSHSPVTSGKGCLNCHTPHAGDFAKLTNDTPAVMCLNCHDKKIEQNGVTVAPATDIADSTLHKHGELKDGQCGGCHAVHGALENDLLQKPFSTAFYDKFSPEHFALCFGCHDVKLATEAKTSVTGFRNGEVNLHFVHASRGERDKNCRACHASHAGKNSRLIRETLPYGLWQMPMRFGKTDTGGSCLPGCHQQQAYDRIKAVPISTQPTSQPVDAVARAEHEDELRVNWETVDDTGKAIIVPDRVRPALLLFVQDNASAAVKEVEALVPEDKSLQVVVIAVGKMSIEPLKQAIPNDWSLVLDPNNVTADTVGVRARPLVLVLKPDGTQIARLSAAAPVLAMKLAPYLDVATGKTDKVHVHAATQPVTDLAARKLERDLRAAHSLLAEGKPQATLDLLQQMNAAAQATPAARCARAEAFVQLNQVSEGLRLLNSIQEQDMTSDVVIVRAKAFIALNEWRSAESALVEYTDRLKNSAAAHQLLGEIYEHGESWKLAVEQYRLANEIRKRESPPDQN
ncbi:hypothetical protein BH10PLA1_BH10PLA1_16820 [soil metagenome]